MNKVKLSSKLPKVGDRLKKVMTANSYEFDPVYILEPCTVVYVNIAKGWYEVEFIETKLRECYKLPEEDELAARLPKRPVKAIELKTGLEYCYPSIIEAARDLCLHASNVSHVLSGRYKQTGGYRFEYLAFNKEDSAWTK